MIFDAIYQSPAMATGSPHAALKRRMQKAGLSYRKAAPVLGVTYQYLCDVLNGKRASVRLLQSFQNLLSETTKKI